MGAVRFIDGSINVFMRGIRASGFIFLVPSAGSCNDLRWIELGDLGSRMRVLPLRFPGLAYI